MVFSSGRSGCARGFLDGSPLLRGVRVCFPVAGRPVPVVKSNRRRSCEAMSSKPFESKPLGPHTPFEVKPFEIKPTPAPPPAKAK